MSFLQIVMRVAIIAACLAVVITMGVVATSVWEADQPKAENLEASAGDSGKVRAACEEAQLKLLKGEVADKDRLEMRVSVDKYCKDE